MSGIAYQIRDLWIERRQSDACFRLEVPEFQVARGEFVAVVGATGCGKSTLLDMLGLILRPDHATQFDFFSGESPPHDLLRSHGRKLARLRRGELGYVLQSGGLLGFLSTRENILLSAKLKGGVRGKRKRLHELATRLGIDDQLSKKPRYLSGGQRQRASIARALIHNPTIVLADEPTASVDRLTAVKIVEELKSIASHKGVAVIVVSHDIQLVAPPVSDRTYTFQIRRDRSGTVISRCVPAAKASENYPAA
ncbi:MAG: ATP-binding cassette domain-containing protein [Verrucomicrobiae bacterium]|nr:ATP-binding cassette domain-containing protein [Verrucomicrobiae bacterium]